jgi:hypothetical protein
MQNSGYELLLMPVNSISISALTTLPDKNISVTGQGDYSFFEGYIIFQIKGKMQISNIRSLLFQNNGFQMLYQFRILFQGNDNKSIQQQRNQVTITIGNINL